MSINQKNIFTIAKREFLTYFKTPVAYVIIAPFLLISSFLYLKSALMTGEASLRAYFDLLPFMLLFLAPAIAMRTFAQEQKSSTLELMYAHPITELEIVLGKFFGALAFFVAFLMTTLGLPFTTLRFSNPDVGVIFSQYLGAVFIGGAFLSIGIAAATLTSSQVASFLLAAAVSFGFMLIGFDMVLLAVPSFLIRFVTELGILNHVTNVSRGLLDLRDISYFVTLIGVFLMIAVIQLSKRLTVEDKNRKTRLNFILGLVLGIGVAFNVFVSVYPLRVDLTLHRLFTLSNGTRQTLEKLPDIVTLTLYTSNNLPGQVQVKAQKVKDLLSDYQKFSKGKLNLVFKDPEANPGEAVEANAQGVQPVQFNSIANNSFAAASGYFGLSFQYGKDTDVIPYLENTDDLEYQITRRILKLTSTEKPSISVFTPKAASLDMTGGNGIGTLTQLLQSQYEVNTVDLDEKGTEIKTKGLLVSGVSASLSATASAKIKEFTDNGGNAVFLLDNHTIDPRSGSATGYKTGLEEYFKTFGVSLEDTVVYETDSRLMETVSLSDGKVQYLLPYPFWVKALVNTKFSPLANVNSLVMAWPFGLKLDPVDGVTQTVLLKTSQRGGNFASSATLNIAPTKLQTLDFDKDLKEQNLGVALENGKSKVVVVTDGEFATDNFAKNSQEGLVFASALVDWVSGDEILASIQPKVGGSPLFQFESPVEASAVEYSNIILPPVAVSLFGIWYLRRRKLLSQRKFSL